MYGIGGIGGSLLGGYTTENNCNQLVFLTLSAISLLTAVVGCFMSNSLENKILNNMSLGDRLKSNIKDMQTGFKIREFSRSILFFILLGALVPSFADYFFYYLTDYAGVSKFQYALIFLYSYIALFAGSLIYYGLFLDKNIHVMMVVACLINVGGSIMSMLMVMGKTFGFSNFVFVFFGTTAVTDAVYGMLITLPSEILIAKMIPQNIEASLFAITTGLVNFATLFAAK